MPLMIPLKAAQNFVEIWWSFDVWKVASFGGHFKVNYSTSMNSITI
jgi:hypothetical protein